MWPHSWFIAQSPKRIPRRQRKNKPNSRFEEVSSLIDGRACVTMDLSFGFFPHPLNPVWILLNHILVLYKMMMEWMMKRNTSLQKYIFLVRVETSVSVHVCVCVWERERERERRRQTEGSEDCYIHLFLTSVLIPYSGPNVSASLMEGSQLVSIVSHCILWAPAGYSPWFTVTAWQRDT